jgi:hypothetical protein
MRMNAVCSARVLDGMSPGGPRGRRRPALTSGFLTAASGGRDRYCAGAALIFARTSAGSSPPSAA